MFNLVPIKVLVPDVYVQKLVKLNLLVTDVLPDMMLSADRHLAPVPVDDKILPALPEDETLSYKAELIFHFDLY